MFTFPTGFFGTSTNEPTVVTFDFTTDSMPSGVVANTTGDTVYRQTSDSSLEPITPGAGVGIFEDRGRGFGILVAPTWKNWLSYDYDTLDQAFRIRWDHTAPGTYLNTADQSTGPITGSFLAPRTRNDDAALIESTDSGALGWVGLNIPGVPSGESFSTLWIKDGPTPPGIRGYLGGTAGGARETMTDPGGADWHQVRVQGANGGYIVMVPASLGGTGQLYATAAMVGSGHWYLPLIAGAATSQANAADVHISDPSVFIVNGALRAKGKMQLLLDNAQLIPTPGALAVNATVISLETPDGLISLRCCYGPASSVDWVLKINGSDLISASYTTSGGVGVTTPGAAGNYLSQIEWAIGYDSDNSLAYLRVGMVGNFTTWTLTTGITETLSTPTSAYLNSNVGTEIFPTLIKEVIAGAPYFTGAEVLLLGDSTNDTTGTPSDDVRPANYIFTDDEVEAGHAIENLAAHGNTTNDQLAKLQAMVVAIPWAFSNIKVVMVDLGWNNFGQDNSQTRIDMNALLNYIVSLKGTIIRSDAIIDLYVPSPAKAGVDGGSYGHWQDFQTDVMSGYYTQATNNLNILSDATPGSGSMNAAAYGGTVDDLYEPYSNDGLHYGLAGKIAKGAIQREQLIADGII